MGVRGDDDWVTEGDEACRKSGCIFSEEGISHFCCGFVPDPEFDKMLEGITEVRVEGKVIWRSDA